MKKVTFLLIVALLLVVGISVNAQGSASYVIVGNDTGLPSNLAQQVSAARGTLTEVHNEVNIAIASSSNPNFASRISGVYAVVPNVVLTRIQPPLAPETLEAAQNGRGGRRNGQTDTTTTVVTPVTGFPPTSGDNDTLFNLQWGHNAVDAQQAWDAGVRGQGVRVAVLDGGFDMDHPDLAPNINYALSADMTGEGIAYGPNSDDPTGIFCHGCHTAGTIGGADNGIGIIGVAPQVELVLVKVLFNHGSGEFGDVLEGILYAASPAVDADVINMSLGADIPQGSGVGSNEIAQLRVAMNRVIGYAYQQGTTVIVSAGNDSRDANHDGSTTAFPAQMPHAIAISALGPLGWALDPSTNLDVQAFYTNYGNSLVHFSAPGGNVDFGLLDSGQICTVGGVTRPCYVFDLVFSAGNGTWYWSAGTSMAAPHATGIVALIISENGGSMSPALVAQELRARADDLGAPGHDPLHGQGRVNSGY